MTVTDLSTVELPPGASRERGACCGTPGREIDRDSVSRDVPFSARTEACRLVSNPVPSTCEEADRELDGMAEVQRLLLPPSVPPIPRMEIATSYEPSRRAGGDHYDFMELPDGRWGIIVADVSGHGAAAAMGVASLHAIVRAAPVKGSPAALLGWANRQLADGYAGRLSSFVTAFYAVFDPASRELVYGSAGHNPPRLRSGQGVRPLDDAQSLPLGIMPDEPYREARLGLERGDVLVLYTDGITEARDGAGELFDVERLDRAVLRSVPEAATTLGSVLRAVRSFSRAARRQDDQTLVVARVT